MTTLQELETAIKQLPEEEIRQLVDRLQDYLEEKWDRPIESDLRTGKLDRLISRAKADIIPFFKKRVILIEIRKVESPSQEPCLESPR